jgi:hypothetical protein
MTNCSEAAYNLFRFTLLSKNASANHLVSHSCKNKGLKVPCFHTLTKNIGGRGVGRRGHFAVHSLAPHTKRARGQRGDGKRPATPGNGDLA